MLGPELTRSIRHVPLESAARMWHVRRMSTKNLRQINVSLPRELVSVVDVATPTHRSRSVVVAEALQLWLEARGIDPPGDWKDRWTVSGNEPPPDEKSRLGFDNE